MTTSFNDRTGMPAQGGGLSRSAGPIFAPPVLDDEAIASRKLGGTQRISRASVSASRRVTEERTLAPRVTRPSGRRDHLQVALDAHAAMRASALRRIDAARAEIDARIAALARDGDVEITSRNDGGREDDGSAACLAGCSSFHGAIGHGLEAVPGRIRNEKAKAQ